MGAIASGGVQVLNEDVLDWYRPSADTVDAVAQVEMRELDRRERVYREGRPLVLVEGRTVILVDDGLATGSTMRAAVQAVRQLQAGRVVVAAPVGARDTCEAMRRVADDVVCVLTPAIASSRSAPGTGLQRDDATKRCVACSKTRRSEGRWLRYFSAAHLPPGQRLFSSQTYSKSPSLSHSGLARISNSCVHGA